MAILPRYLNIFQFLTPEARTPPPCSPSKPKFILQSQSSKPLILEEDNDSQISENEYALDESLQQPSAFDFLTNKGDILVDFDDSFSSSEMVIPSIARKSNNFSKIKSSLSKVMTGSVYGLDLVRTAGINPSALPLQTQLLVENTTIKGSIPILGRPRLLRFEVGTVDREGAFGRFNAVFPVRKAFNVLVKHPPYFRHNSVVACKILVYNNSTKYFQVQVSPGNQQETVFPEENKKFPLEIEDQQIPFSIQVRNLTSGELFHYLIDVPVF